MSFDPNAGGGGPPPMGGGGPPGMDPGAAPNLLPFPSTQPGPVGALLGPWQVQAQQDLDAMKQQQLQTAMALIMQAVAQQPNPAAQDAQTMPEPPLASAAGQDTGGGDPNAAAPY